MTAPLQPRPAVDKMQPYALSRADVPDGVAPILLNQNESPLPPSPLAIEAAARAAERAHRYSDPDWRELRAAIAEVHQLDPESILVGAGSMELIGAAVAAYAGPGDEVLSSEHGYAFFRTAAERAQARYVAAPEPGKTVSVEAILDCVTDATRIVCVANPGNPTGTRIGRPDIVRLRERMPANALLILDEAYGEFADDLGEPMFDLARRGDTIVLRTFSKAYALAGMRVGWGAFGGDLAVQTRKLLNPNNVSAVSQSAAAAAMRDQAYMRDLCRSTTAAREAFSASCRAIGLDTTASFTNFVLVGFGSADRAVRADRALRENGIVMRPMGFYGLGDCLRATVGNTEEMKRTAEVLGAFMAKEQ